MATDPGGFEAEAGYPEARDANLANWEERVPLHTDAYGLDRYRDDPAHLSQVVRTDLDALGAFLPTGLAGLEVCHLQCHIGTDTVSLARAGAARIVGVDFSPSALEAASSLARELGIDAAWVQADVLDAKAAVDAALGGDQRFDVVYTSIGTITWLPDLERWAAQIAGLLRPRGLFYIRDGHPALYALDERVDGLVTRYPYFGDGTPLAWDEETTYVGDGTLASTRTYEWPHPLSETVGALLGAGLELLALEEGRTLPWRFAERMVEREDGDFEWPGHDARRMPCTFTVVARAR
ncbi:class I SAM-dependent methyltransferase [Demequina subtropica]|uniref:class I SAM-dependent methyltransferase n=1 Tax=Demequina subtropica TaxID=1638989 RepID=UPI0007810A4A|nr:class I SAM-dependent methyltransferase [Demequina subtropica]